MAKDKWANSDVVGVPQHQLKTLTAKAALFDEMVEGIQLFIDSVEISMDADIELTTTEALYYGYFQALLARVKELK